jgi:hypothetical protein
MTIRKVSARAARRALGAMGSAMGDASQPIAAPIYGGASELVPMPNGSVVSPAVPQQPVNTIAQVPTPLASGTTPIAITTPAVVLYYPRQDDGGMGLGTILLLAAGGLGIYFLAKA